MKIAFIVPSFPSISQTFVLNQITGLMDCGHEVDIFARTRDNDDKIHEDVIAYCLLERTTYLEQIPKSRLRCFIKGMYLAASAFPMHPKTVMRCFNMFRYGKKAVSLALPIIVFPFFGRGPYDIIHCHFGPNGDLGVFLKDVGAISGKVITSFHGYDVTSYAKRRGPLIYENLFNMGDLFLPISNRWKEKLISMGCTPERIFVHRMGIDVRRFDLREDKTRENGRVIILTVARLVEKKGVEYGIRAVAKLIKNFPNVEYKIAGDGPLKKDLNDLIANLNLNNSVRLLGWKTQDEISCLMDQSDILLAPSVTGKDGDQEGIPVVLMEAMARGLPVISTSHSGIPEIIINGETGLLVPERDIEALSQKLEYIILHPELKEQMRRKGRKYVEDNYDINKLNAKLVEIYERLLK
jgi:colanic acid/amylovoran biosynthesis glycosyltransferase